MMNVDGAAEEAEESIPHILSTRNFNTTDNVNVAKGHKRSNSHNSHCIGGGYSVNDNRQKNNVVLS